MTLELDLIQTLGVAVLVFVLGKAIKDRTPFFQKFFIPAPVIGGLIFSVLIYIGTVFFNLDLTMDKVLQNFFMNIFFTCIGFTVSIKTIVKSGKRGAILAVVAVGFLVIQNVIGVSLASLFGLNKLLGVAMGSVAMSGGVGSGAAFGPTFESLGAAGGTTVGVAAATFGLLMGSLIGGPVAKRRIDKLHLKSTAKEDTSSVKTEETHKLSQKKMLNAVLFILFAAAIGTIVSKLLSLTGLTFPYYVGCLFGGTIIKNLAEQGVFKIDDREIEITGHIALNLFLSLTLMNLNLVKLAALALPMLVILIVQALVMILYAYFVTFNTMGRDYEAAVMAAGHCGVGLGQTPNALANMSSVIEENGPAPEAWFILPVITVVFINIFNPIIITAFINLLT